MARSAGELRFTKEQLIERLEARRPWAQRLDAAALVEHRKAEKTYLVDFRAICREALKWDYEQVKEHGGTVRIEDRANYGRRPPSCPSLTEARLDRELAVVRAMRDGARVVIKEGGGWALIWWLLTHDESIKDEAC